MEPKRIYQVAKELHISSEALMALLKKLNYNVKSHMSTVSEAMLENINRELEKEKDVIRKDIKKKMEFSRTLEKKKIPPKQKQTPTPKRDKKPNPASVANREEKITIPSLSDLKKSNVQKAGDKRKRSRKKKRRIDPKDVELSVKKTLAKMEIESRSKKKRSKSRQTGEVAEEADNVIQVTEFITVAELASYMGVSPSTVIAKCLELGLVVSINMRLDMDTITLVADEFDFTVKKLDEYRGWLEEEWEEDIDDESQMQPRPPVVTVMGHVDHGKTSLLDYIRKTNVIAGEAGSITQHIGAYEVDTSKGYITFLDTPGHEAFTAMRARGVQVTDIVVLVVASNDHVMAQTVEAIDHAKAAGVPIIIAINKIDRQDADPEQTKKELSEHGILIEEWGGKFQCQEISAKIGTNMDKLLELILLEAEMLELKANPNKRAKGVVIEAHLDKGRGPVATIIIQEGTLKTVNVFVAGSHWGRVRAMLDERGKVIKAAGPSCPVRIFGISGIPKAGDTFFVISSESDAREISHRRATILREQQHHRLSSLSLQDIHKQIIEGKLKDLNLIIKGDMDGNVEALSDALAQLSNDEVRVLVIHRGVGAISESDVLLASASGAIIYGYNVRPHPEARKLAENEKVDIQLFDVIYDATNAMKKALSGLLEPELKENTLGTLQVRETFRIPNVGIVAGCYVQTGSVRRNDQARLIRDNVVLFKGRVEALKRFKDDVKEVGTGYECGVSLGGYSDIKVDDVIEVYEIVEHARSL